MEGDEKNKLELKKIRKENKRKSIFGNILHRLTRGKSVSSDQEGEQKKGKKKKDARPKNSLHRPTEDFGVETTETLAHFQKPRPPMHRRPPQRKNMSSIGIQSNSEESIDHQILPPKPPAQQKPAFPPRESKPKQPVPLPRLFNVRPLTGDGENDLDYGGEDSSLKPVQECESAAETAVLTQDGISSSPSLTEDEEEEDYGDVDEDDDNDVVFLRQRSPVEIENSVAGEIPAGEGVTVREMVKRLSYQEVDHGRQRQNVKGEEGRRKPFVSCPAACSQYTKDCHDHQVAKVVRTPSEALEGKSSCTELQGQLPETDECLGHKYGDIRCRAKSSSSLPAPSTSNEEFLKKRQSFEKQIQDNIKNKRGNILQFRHSTGFQANTKHNNNNDERHLLSGGSGKQLRNTALIAA